MKRYYSIDARGRILEAQNEPRIDMLLLEEPTMQYPLWDGEKWIEDDVKKESVKRKIIESLANTDAGMSRVVEDLIFLLVSKNVVTNDEMNEYMKQKIAERVNLRTGL